MITAYIVEADNDVEVDTAADDDDAMMDIILVLPDDAISIVSDDITLVAVDDNCIIVDNEVRNIGHSFR